MQQSIEDSEKKPERGFLEKLRNFKAAMYTRRNKKHTDTETQSHRHDACSLSEKS